MTSEQHVWLHKTKSVNILAWGRKGFMCHRSLLRSCGQFDFPSFGPVDFDSDFISLVNSFPKCLFVLISTLWRWKFWLIKVCTAPFLFSLDLGELSGQCWNCISQACFRLWFASFNILLTAGLKVILNYIRFLYSKYSFVFFHLSCVFHTASSSILTMNLV